VLQGSVRSLCGLIDDLGGYEPNRHRQPSLTGFGGGGVGDDGLGTATKRLG
jgi:hypothetical protein